MEIDGTQWVIVIEQETAYVTSRLNGGVYRIPTKILRKALSVCDVVSVNEDQSVSPDMESCKCPGRGRPNCQNIITRGQAFQARVAWFENYPNSKEYAANLLRHKNGTAVTEYKGNEVKKPHIKYFINDVLVCRLFYMCCLCIDHRVADDISSLVLGLEPRPRSLLQKLSCPKYPIKESQHVVCKAFYRDFFSMCQVPAEGVRLFSQSILPVNLCL